MQFLQRGIGADPQKTELLSNTLGVSRVLSELLVMRGLDTEERAGEFLSSDTLLDPFCFDMMEETVGLIEEMIEAEVPIAVYSDYDCDGVCGASILYLALKKMGADVKVYIPDRFTEGYGTNPRAIEMLADEAGLIITVDCGIASVDDVALARDFGAEVIILDHHECGVLPDTPYILNPKRPGESYPNKHLCGAGIAFKVACALLGEDALRLVDLAGIATIGDIVSLTGENRVIAAMGLRRLREAPNPGIRQLMAEAQLEPEKLDSHTVSFVIVPRINAAGRLEHAIRAFDLITTGDRAKRLECARHINDLNEQRKIIQKNIAALSETQAEGSPDRILMVRGEGFHKGVVGLAAARITEKYYRPAIVLSEEDGMLTGSARSIEGVNIYEIMNTMADCYTRFGGHSQAAGVTFPAERFEEVRAGLNAAAEKLEPSVFRRKYYYDMEISPEQVDLELIDELQKLEPYGLDNPSPVFLMRSAKVSNAQKIGKNKEHTRCMLGKLAGIRFGGELIEGADYTLVGSLAVNEFRGDRTAQFRIEAAELAGGGISPEVRLSFLRSFPAEVSALVSRQPHPDNSAEFYARLTQALRETGAIVLVNSEAGLSVVRSFPEQIPVFGKDPGGRDSRILLGCAPREDCTLPVFRVGAYSAKVGGEDLFSAELTQLYREEAERYFVPEAELEEYLDAFRQTTAEYSSISQLLGEVCKKITGADLKKAWFAMNVFFEEKLIALSKSDRIHIIFRNQSGEKAYSSLYGIFAGFLNEE